LMLASIAVAGVSILAAFALFRKDAAAADARLAANLGGVHRLLLNKYYVDELYGAVFVRGLALDGGNGLWWLDRHGIDGGDGKVRPAWPLSVNGIAWVCRDVVAKLSDWWDRWIVDGILCRLTDNVFDNFSYAFRALQNGLVQHYALMMLILMLFMVGIGSMYIP
jgi:NADH:ubiquinone oxidoreductase subunit 5 (subunit L)/multisubunit Na+/H+ antiporter MnhA subunit